MTLGLVCSGLSSWDVAHTLILHGGEVGVTGRRGLREAFGVFVVADLVSQLGTAPQDTHTISQAKLSSPGTKKT